MIMNHFRKGFNLLFLRERSLFMQGGESGGHDFLFVKVLSQNTFISTGAGGR